MKFCIYLVFLLVFKADAKVAWRQEKAVACPDSFLIDPCTCTVSGDQVDLSCSSLTSLQSLTDIFGRTFPTNSLHSIVITASRLGPLPNDVFRGKSFEIITFSNNRYTSFDNSGIFSSSNGRLKSLTVRQDTDEWNFQLSAIGQLTVLTDLELSGYNMALIGTVASQTLVSLTLRSDLLASVPSLGAVPSLQVLNLDGSVIASVSSNQFSGFTNLKELYLGHNKLTSVPAGTLGLPSNIVTVDLSSNLIDQVEPGWISGQTSSTTIQLVNNYLSVLPPESFETVIQALVPTGKLMVDGNPLSCDCSVAWIVTQPAYLSIVSDGRCANGTKLTTLNPTYFVDNC